LKTQPTDATTDLSGLLRTALLSTADSLAIGLTGEQAESLLAYLALLQRWNSTYNLTSVREPGQMLTQHIADCLAVVNSLRRTTEGRAARLLDVGSGGGLPGAVIALTSPQIGVTCIDAVGKKAAFVRQVAAELRVTNLQVHHGRVESLRGTVFDIVCSRAYASLSDFVNGTRHCLSNSGVWMAMKGRRPDEELARLAADIDVFHVEPLQVPGLDADRCLVWMRLSKAAFAAARSL